MSFWRKAEENSRLLKQIEEADRELNLAHTLIRKQGVELEALRTRLRSALVTTEIARKSVSPLTMTYQHLHNISRILAGKEPL